MGESILQKDIDFVLSQKLPWNNFKNKTILISGAGGFIPSFLALTLLALNKKHKLFNVKVIGLVRSKDKALKVFKKNIPGLKLIEKDVTEKIVVKERVDFIIHAASQASPRYYHTDPVGTLKANTLGTYHLLELARVKKVKAFLYMSSGEVYGVVKGKKPIHEKTRGFLDPTSVRSCYGESKRMGETMCASYAHQYGVPARIVRPFHTYGPGVKLDDGRVFADFVQNIIDGKNIIMKSDGKAKRTFCYIADAAAAFFAVLLKGISGEAYNVSNDTGETSIIGLAKLLAGLFPEKKLKIISTTRSKKENYASTMIMRAHPDISKIKKLGWRPRISLKTGFKHMIESYL